MEKTAKDKIVKTLIDKSCMKQKVYDNTKEVFKMLKETLKELVTEYNKELKPYDNRVLLEYRDKGTFEVELKIAGDLLIFNMHSNIFEFSRNHGVWKISYVKNDKLAVYCGIINVYNFLSDSFKYNRVNDLGYLLGRLFINKDKHFFVEGKREIGFLYNDFGNAIIDKSNIKKILESIILYTLDFDLLVPPYDDVIAVTVDQMKERMSKHKMQTGKRLGFKFYADNDGMKS